MNTRPTPSINETFLEILRDCKEQKISAVMLLGVKGIIKAEGLVKAIYLDAPKPYVELDSGIKVMIKTIRTINGVFSSL